MKKPNTRARTEAALRSGRPLPPTAVPAIGDVLWIEGAPFKLTGVVSTGGRGPGRFKSYRFTDSNGRTIDVTPRKDNS